MRSSETTIILPVYGKSEFLEEAIQSVIDQTSHDWKLIIADDGSDERTQAWLGLWLTSRGDSRISWHRRETNLGLFSNLNKAIKDSTNSWIILLCSDDRLMPSALEQLYLLRKEWQDARLILSTFNSMNADGSARPSDSARHHDKISDKTALIQPKEMVMSLLRLGSINGNLTGMAFSRELLEDAGPFREEWRHAADWEWIVRAAGQSSVLMNRSPIACIRTHEAQLSNTNRRSGDEVSEIADVVVMLVSHPLLSDVSRRHKWASHIMQFQLWNILTGKTGYSLRSILQALSAVQNSVGIWHATAAMLKFLPVRLGLRISSKQS